MAVMTHDRAYRPPLETRLTLKYQGPAVDAGRMDVYQASTNMIAFSEFMVAASKATFGDQIEARAEVAGFGQSSFLTNLVFELAGPAGTLLSATGVAPDQIIKTVVEAIKVWKFLRGSPPKALEPVSAQVVNVTNNNGQIIQVQTSTLHLVLHPKAGDAVQKFIQEPLLRDGIDRIEIDTSDGIAIAEATKGEAEFFRPVTPSETVTDATIEMALIIEAPVFKEGNKWRFSDGQASFHADILDDAFLARVDRGERFGKGDVLRARVRLTQTREGDRLSTERAVIEVLAHREGQSQFPLFQGPEGT